MDVLWATKYSGRRKNGVLCVSTYCQTYRTNSIPNFDIIAPSSYIYYSTNEITSHFTRMFDLLVP